MTALPTILIILVASAIGAFCGWSAYLRRTSGPQDSSFVWRFVFHLWLLVSFFGIAFVAIPESIRDWLTIPLGAAGLLLIFRFRRQRNAVQDSERHLDPRVRDGFWIKKVR
jgi:hypothetical protein